MSTSTMPKSSLWGNNDRSEKVQPKERRQERKIQMLQKEDSPWIWMSSTRKEKAGTASGGESSCPSVNTWWEGARKVEAASPHWGPVMGQEALGTNWNPIYTQENGFDCKDDKVPEQATQRLCNLQDFFKTWLDMALTNLLQVIPAWAEGLGWMICRGPFHMQSSHIPWICDFCPIFSSAGRIC